MEFYVEEYCFENFIEIARRLLKQRYGLDVPTSEKIAIRAWNKMKSNDIRNVINMAKGSSRDIDWITEVQPKYGEHRSY